MGLTKKQSFIIRELMNGAKLISASDKRGIRGFLLIRKKRVPSGMEEVREIQNMFAIEGMQRKGLLEAGDAERMEAFGVSQVVGTLRPTKEAMTAFEAGE